MKYLLVVECEICGTPALHEGDTKRNEDKGYIDTIATQRAGMHVVENTLMCSSCKDKYQELQQRHKAEMTNFFMGREEQERNDET